MSGDRDPPATTTNCRIRVSWIMIVRSNVDRPDRGGPATRKRTPGRLVRPAPTRIITGSPDSPPTPSTTCSAEPCRPVSSPSAHPRRQRADHERPPGRRLSTLALDSHRRRAARRRRAAHLRRRVAAEEAELDLAAVRRVDRSTRGHQRRYLPTRQPGHGVVRRVGQSQHRAGAGRRWTVGRPGSTGRRRRGRSSPAAAPSRSRRRNVSTLRPASRSSIAARNPSHPSSSRSSAGSGELGSAPRGPVGTLPAAIEFARQPVQQGA